MAPRSVRGNTGCVALDSCSSQEETPRLRLNETFFMKTKHLLMYSNSPTEGRMTNKLKPKSTKRQLNAY